MNQLDNVQVQVFGHGKVLLEVLGGDTRVNSQSRSCSIDMLESHADGFLQDHGVGVEQLAQATQDHSQLVGGRHLQLDFPVVANAIAAAVVLDLYRREDRVWDHQQGAVEGADDGRAQADFLHRSFDRAEAAEVTRLYRLGSVERDGADDVL